MVSTIDRDLVSVVIPTTLTRPALLDRALSSVRGQRGVATEIIVIADVADPSVLPNLGDDIRVVAVEGGPKGPGPARNRGVEVSRGAWVAFLDDDDEWRVDKLARQLEAVRDRGELVVSAHSQRLVIDGESRDRIAPAPPRPDEDLSEWLLCTRWPFGSGTGVQTSTLLASRALLQRVPFRPMRWFEDFDLLLRSAIEARADFVYLPDTLSNYHLDRSRAHLSGVGTCAGVREWVEESQHLFTPRSAASVWLTACVRCDDAPERLSDQIRTAFHVGSPAPFDLARMLAKSFVPRGARVALLRRWERAVATARGVTVRRGGRRASTT